jgi:glycosyltransferase involved in cell wall biosynthesis
MKIINHSIYFSTEQPLVSVIIPTLNRYVYLKDVMEDLEKQDYKILM